MQSFQTLTKNQEKLIASLLRRKKRIEHGLCICEGLRTCQELYDNNPNSILFAVISESFAQKESSRFKNIDIYFLKDSKFKNLVSTVNPQGILFIARIPDYTDNINDISSPFALVLDKISDPGNLGTIIRTALSVGLSELWYSSGTVDPFSEKTIRSALAAQFRIKLKRFEKLDLLVKQLRKQKFNTIYRTEPSGGESCFKANKLFDKSIIIFGNEAKGVEELENSIPLHIPMPGGFESINVAQAVTVILFEAVRREKLV